MKIHVIIPSRHRVRSLSAVLTSLDALALSPQDIRYTVLCDEDDKETMVAAHDEAVIGPRTLVNARQNEVIAASDADVFMPWADDLFPLVFGWDAIINQVLTKAKIPAFSWQEVQDPRNHTAIVLEAQWVKAAGRFFPEHFPFWFSDTWLKEVFAFVYGQDMPIIEALPFSHKRGVTQGMRDLEFWFRVFARTRGERIDEAKRVAAAYGIAWFEKPQLIDIFDKSDEAQLERVPQYEAVFGANQGEPSDAYKAAKAKAARLFTVDNAFAEAA